MLLRFGALWNETILKTDYSKDALPKIQQERESARNAFLLGIVWVIATYKEHLTEVIDKVGTPD